jgi:hypothetical protein
MGEPKVNITFRPNLKPGCGTVLHSRIGNCEITTIFNDNAEEAEQARKKLAELMLSVEKKSAQAG